MSEHSLLPALSASRIVVEFADFPETDGAELR